MYWSNRLRGVASDKMKVDTKNAIYNCRLRNMNVIAGSDGLNEGANPVVLGPGDPDSGYTGGADCGP
jgi:hypothetical protein